MILSDTHLIGPFKGHWFDRLRREWQMYRSFQTAITLFNPEVVFILGNLFVFFFKFPLVTNDHQFIYLRIHFLYI